MVELTLSPVLRRECIVYLPFNFSSSLDFKEDDFLMFLSKEERSHSFVQRVVAIKEDETVSSPYVEVDSRQATPYFG